MPTFGHIEYLAEDWVSGMPLHFFIQVQRTETNNIQLQALYLSGIIMLYDQCFATDIQNITPAWLIL